MGFTRRYNGRATAFNLLAVHGRSIFLFGNYVISKIDAGEDNGRNNGARTAGK